MIGVIYVVSRVRVARLRGSVYSLFTLKCMVFPYKSTMSKFSLVVSALLPEGVTVIQFNLSSSGGFLCP